MTLNVNQPLDPIFLEFILRTFIRTKISPTWAKYIYLNEKAINPAFQTIEINKSLALNDKRIFVLRSDLILATGIKNAYQEHGYAGLQNAFDKRNHPFINWQDRYGHPSLAIADSQFDGQVFYAGFICQRKDSLEVFLSSGRFNREFRLAENIASLSSKQTTILESYLALKFTQVFGKQPVRFYDTTSGKQDDEDSALFFKDKPFPTHKLCRVYNEESILEAGKLALVDLNYTTAQNYINNNISAIHPPYKYDNEENINPAFENIQQVKYPLALEDKRIWVLRKDFNLILGIKNAYKKDYNYHGFEDHFNPKLFTFIDLKDRYGHPSLCLTEEGYDGSVFYAGYLCQRAKFLQVYLVSGRFDRKDLNKEQTSILEA